jgi:hypothetical protein
MHREYDPVISRRTYDSPMQFIEKFLARGLSN